MLVDLHLHTTCSDGIWPRERLFDEIRERRLELFCVSDHDTLDAYPLPPDLEPLAIPGLEVDTHHAGHTVHLLAYGVGDKDSPLLRVLIEQRRARETRMEQMIERCRALGLDVTIDDVRRQAATAASLGRPHLARAFVERGFVPDVQTAFDRYLADEGQGYVALERLTSDRAIALVHDSGGVAVVAHPKRLRAPEHLRELLDAGADGIEVLHPTADEADRALYERLARERDVLITGGTDFHAPVEGRPLGVNLSERDVRALRDAIAKRAAAA